MAKVIVFLFGVVAAIFANPMGHTQLSSPVSPEQIQAFKEELEEDTKDGGVTCENYHELCARASGDDTNSICHIMLQGYLCEKLQDLAGVQEIISRIEKHHPESINLAAGHEFDNGVEAEEEDDEEFFDDSDDYDDSDEHEEE